MKTRCGWVKLDDELYCQYHDEEWGRPVTDDQKLFEFLILETFQAGLSWLTVLRKRENFRKAFNNFDVKKVAAFTDEDYNRLMNDAGIIRNSLKIKAAISNAQAFIQIQKEYGSFSSYIWGFINFEPLINTFATLKDIPAKTMLSDRISKDLQNKGFKFVGSTVVYAHMQATGMVMDHTLDCFCYKSLSSPKK
jgi:DNA-3-methyladenine glycosylase I